MIPDEKFEAHCTVMLVTGDEHQQKQQREQQQHQQYDISLSAFSDIYNEYLSDHSEIETASIETDTDSSSSASISNATKESFNQKSPPNIRSNLNSNRLFSVQLEVNFLLLEAERR